MAHLAERQESYVAGFDQFRRDPAFGTGVLSDTREAAFARFMARGLPTTREEEWRHTSIAPLAEIPFQRAEAPTVSRHTLAPWLVSGTIGTLVVINGRPALGLSSLTRLPRSLTVRTLEDSPDSVIPAQPIPGSNVFVDLNTAFFEDVIVIEVAPKAAITEPLHVLFLSAPGRNPGLVSPRLVVIAGEGSRVSIIESYADAGSAMALTNAVTDVHVGPAAFVDHVKLQRHGQSFHLGTMFVRTGRGGTFTSHSISLGGRIARNDVVSVLAGEGAECTLNGLYVAGGDSLVDTHTTIDHAEPHCPSHEVYKGILTGNARAVFNGKIVVRPDAQKTNAKQTNKALLLTDTAQINTKPQLEIFADDVKCTHGAAIGQLDEDAMFYLRARGIGPIEARNMLIHAFAGDVLNGITAASVRESAMKTVEAILSID